jgi:hypothetical protein
MKNITREDERDILILNDINNIICETVPIDFFDSIELAGKITEYIKNNKRREAENDYND